MFERMVKTRDVLQSKKHEIVAGLLPKEIAKAEAMIEERRGKLFSEGKVVFKELNSLVGLVPVNLEHPAKWLAFSEDVGFAWDKCSTNERQAAEIPELFIRIGRPGSSIFSLTNTNMKRRLGVGIGGRDTHLGSFITRGKNDLEIVNTLTLLDELVQNRITHEELREKVKNATGKELVVVEVSASGVKYGFGNGTTVVPNLELRLYGARASLETNVIAAIQRMAVGFCSLI